MYCSVTGHYHGFGRFGPPLGYAGVLRRVTEFNNNMSLYVLRITVLCQLITSRSGAYEKVRQY